MLCFYKFRVLYLSLFVITFAGTCFADQTREIPKFVIDFLELPTLAPQPKIGKQFYTSFETIEEFKPFYIVPQNNQNTATHDLVDNPRFVGNHAHEAHIYGSNDVSSTENTNHRAYPTFQFAKTPMGILTGAVFVEFEVWADIELSHRENASWFSLATFTSYDDQYWYRAYLINVDANYNIHLMHVPHHGQSIHDIYQTTSIALPKKQWARISTYIDYTTKNRFNSPFIAVWQDGVLVSAARFDNRVDLITAFMSNNRPKCLNGLSTATPIADAEIACGLNFTNGLAQAHFGLYAPPLLDSGQILNDDLTVSEVLF